MKKLLIFGGSGMLGSELAIRADQLGFLVKKPAHGNISIYNDIDITSVFSTVQPDFVVNCAGVINHSAPIEEMHRTNALGPKIIANSARFFNVPFFHISTDCVFSGISQTVNRIEDKTDASDAYGSTKAEGEKLALENGAYVVRTSFIGFKHGLLAWLIKESSQGNLIEAWMNAFWNGSTVYEVVEGILQLVLNMPESKLIHLSSNNYTNKASVLIHLASIFELNVDIRPIPEPSINRLLEPTHVIRSVYDDEVVGRLVKEYEAIGS